MGSEGSVEYIHNGYKGFIGAGFNEPPFIEFLNNIDEHIKEVVERHYKDFDKKTDRLVSYMDIPLGGSKRKAWIKQDDYERDFKLVKSVKYSFKQSRGLRAWEAAARLLDGGVLVPEPIAYIEKRSMGRFVRGYLFAEFVDGTMLRDLVKEPGKGHVKERVRLIREAGAIMGRLHATGSTHGDLKSTNFLVENGPKNGPKNERGAGGGRLFLIDCEDVRTKSNVSKSERIREVSRFIKSVADINDDEIKILLQGYGQGISIDDIREKLS